MAFIPTDAPLIPQIHLCATAISNGGIALHVFTFWGVRLDST